MLEKLLFLARVQVMLSNFKQGIMKRVLLLELMELLSNIMIIQSGLRQLESESIVFGDFVVSGVTTSARLLVSGISTFTGLVDANGGAHIDNLRLGIDADNDITTSSGNLTLDSTGGTVEVNDNLQVDGQTDLNGDINLGNATSDTITATGRFDSDLVPSTDGDEI